MLGRRNSGHHPAARVLLTLVVAVACLGSAAYAATRPGKGRTGGKEHGQRAGGEVQRPPRPSFIEVPPAVGVGGGFQFRFHVAPPPSRESDRTPPGSAAAPVRRWRRFQCRLDGSDWGNCSSPFVLPALDSGDHSFAVRALSPGGRPGPAAHYRWSQLEPMEFTVEPQLSSLEELMPGAPPQQLPVRIGNPNPVPIEVTALTVAVAPEIPDCPSDPNFAVTPSRLTPAAPLSVPAGGSADLPAAAAPTLALRELSSGQNSCQGADVHLVFSGEARG